MKIAFETKDRELLACWKWATERALACVRDDAPVGPCYEAALPDRHAFCMRDMAHQAVGAHYLGLDRHNRNMLYRFAENISEARGFCSFWEITFDGTPCPADYQNDGHFWYNLPANFDVMRTASELTELTGDRFYLYDETMARFHMLTVGPYIEKWDHDGDGIVDRGDSHSTRGICSYDESTCGGYRYALDTYALQYRALRIGAKLSLESGNTEKASRLSASADLLARDFAGKFWMPEEEHLASVIGKDGTRGGGFTVTKAVFPLREGLLPASFVEKQLDYAQKGAKEINIEEQTYLAEVLFSAGRDEEARAVLSGLCRPETKRRDYPEVSFTVVGDIVRGYMGLCPAASDEKIVTRFGGDAQDSAVLYDAPVFDGTVTLSHEGRSKSILQNDTGREILWEARLAGGTVRRRLAAGERAAASL